MHSAFEHLHAQKIRGLLKSKILHYIGMIEVLQRLALQLEGFDNCDLPAIIPVAVGLGYLDLFDRNHLPGRGVKRKIHSAIRALADQLASNPFEYCYSNKKVIIMKDNRLVTER